MLKIFKKHHSFELINVILGQFFIALLVVISVRIYTEIVDRNVYGEAMMLMGMCYLLDGFLIMTINQILLRYCSKYNNIDEQKSLAAGLTFVFLKWYLMGLIPLLLTAWAVSKYFNWPVFTVLTIVVLIICYLVINTVRIGMVSLLNVNRRQFQFSVWNVTETMLCIFSTIATLQLFKKDAIAFLIGQVLGNLISTLLFSYIFYGGKFFSKLDLRKTSSIRKELFHYGMPFSCMSGIGWLGNYADRYLLAYFGGTGVVGVYSACAGLIARPFTIVGSVLSNFFRPILFKASSDLNKEKAFRVIAAWYISAMFVGLSGIILIGLFGHIAINLILAETYRSGAKNILMILSVGFSFTIMTHVLDNSIFAKERSSDLLIPQVFSIVLGLLMICVLTFRYGVLGAAAGRSASEIIRWVLTLVVLVNLEKKLGGK